jgi:3'-5' exonuclease
MADDAIIKAGCSIDQDMMELYLYTHHQHEVATSPSQGLIHEARSRLDLGGIRLVNFIDSNDESNETTAAPTNNDTNNNSVGLKTLAAEILGVRLVKSTRLAASDWSRLPLTPAQIAYSARDAWTSAAIVAELTSRSSLSLLDSFSTMSNNCDGGGVSVAKQERPIQELVQRQSKRKRAQQLLKHLVYLQTRRRRREQQQQQQQAMLNNDTVGHDSESSLSPPPPPPPLFQMGSWRQRVLQNLKTVVQENKWDAPEIFNVATTTTTTQTLFHRREDSN